MFSQDLHDAYVKALDELSEASIESIQRSTAYTWAARSLAAYYYFEATADMNALHDAVAWLHDASEYAHEALEHAALHPDPSVLDELRPILLSAARRAQLHPIFQHPINIPHEYAA